MNKYYLSFAICTAIFLAGCQDNSEEPESPKETETELPTTEVVMEETIVYKAGKELVATQAVKKQAVYSTTLQSDENIVELYIVAIDEVKEKLEFSSAFGEEGDIQFKGNYAFFLSEVGDNEAVLQDQLEFSNNQMTIDFKNMPFQTFVLDNKTFLQVTQQETSMDLTMNIWVFYDGELHDVKMDNDYLIFVANKNVKVIDDEYIQTYSYDRDYKVGWTFTTYKWNNKKRGFHSIYTNSYTGEDLDYGKYIVELWRNHPYYYNSFPTITFDEKSKMNAMQGQLDGTPYPIGTSIDKILEEHPNYIGEDYYNGGKYFAFPDGYSYFYHEVTRVTTGVILNGAKVKNDYLKLDSIFGEPRYSGYDDYSGGKLTVYQLDDFQLSIEANGDNEINSISLQKKNDFE